MLSKQKLGRLQAFCKSTMFQDLIEYIADRSQSPLDEALTKTDFNLVLRAQGEFKAMTDLIDSLKALRTMPNLDENPDSENPDSQRPESD